MYVANALRAKARVSALPAFLTAVVACTTRAALTAEISEYIKNNGSVKGFPGVDGVSRDELLELPCDLLAPCAVQNVLHKGNASKIKARFVVEANAPTTPEAERDPGSRWYYRRSRYSCHSAGVTVGYFEWVQGLMRLFWTGKAEVYKQLADLNHKTSEKVYEMANKHKCSLRHAAMIIALERIMEARRLRGLFP